MPTIGIIYPGELGCALGELLRQQDDCTVITTVEGRSARSAANCYQSGITVLDTLQDVIRESDVVFSFVPPGSALEVANRVRAIWRTTMRLRTYVDGNSISPETMRKIVEVFRGTQVDVVDAAVHGQANRVRDKATLYLSGQAAGDVAALFHSAVRIRIVGHDPGRASLQKMLLGSISKGMIALYCQAIRAAEPAGMCETFCSELEQFYPEMRSFVARSLPTYRQHALRRCAEMLELASTLESFQLDSALARSIGKMFADLNGHELGGPINEGEKA